MVERAVNIVYNHIYGPLRHRNFTSLQQLNEAIYEQLEALNEKPYKNTPYSRRYFFNQQEFILSCALKMKSSLVELLEDFPMKYQFYYDNNFNFCLFIHCSSYSLRPYNIDKRKRHKYKII